MLSVEDFRKKYPGSTEEQVALYAAAVAAEQANPPQPEPDLPMPRITVPVTTTTRSTASLPSMPSQSRMMPRYGGVIRDWNHLDVPPPEAAPDLTSDIRRIVLGRRLTARERAQAERPDMNGDDLLALLAGVPNAREFEALEGGD
jgi:hypothetical protein